MGRFAQSVLFVAVPGTAIGFLLVGWLARRTGTGEFDWELASIFGTAAGTTLLALATAILALATWREITSINAPTIIAEPQYVRDFPPRLGVTLTNVGVGPAIAVRVDVVSDINNVRSLELAVVAPGQTFAKDLDIEPPLDENGKPTVRVPGEWIKLTNYKIGGEYRDRTMRKAGRILDLRDF